MKQMRKCKWCGSPFTPPSNRRGNAMKYCSVECRREARKEQNRRHQEQYIKRYGRSDKSEYFRMLGTSNLREHCKHDFGEELRLIRAEKRRLEL